MIDYNIALVQKLMRSDAIGSDAIKAMIIEDANELGNTDMHSMESKAIGTLLINVTVLCERLNINVQEAYRQAYKQLKRDMENA